MGADALTGAITALLVIGFIAAMRWIFKQGTHRSVTDWEHLGDGRYRLEYEWLHKGEWYGGWVRGERNLWINEETGKRVHFRVEAYLCVFWAALERGRAKREQQQEQPMQAEVYRCHQL